MAKRKTRQEKIKSDYRRQLSFDQEPTFSYQIAPKKQELSQTKSQFIYAVPTSKTIVYPYLKADLRKTMLLTMGIVVIQFLLYFLLKNHTFVLPGLIY